MYQQHFGLERAVFQGGIAGEAEVFVGPRQRSALDNIEIASTTRDSVLVLHGAPGLGKTTIAAHALRAAGTRLAIGWLTTAPQTPEELLDLLLGEFGFDAFENGRAERLQTWRQYLRELGATDTRASVAVEHADELPLAVLQALDALTRADPNGGPGANLLLMGPATLGPALEAPALRHLKQRVRLLQPFAPFEEAETEAYLRHAVTTAGGDFEAVFAPGTTAAIHAYAAGVPRVINNLCETALAIAARRGAAALTPEIAVSTAVELCGLRPPPAGAETDDAVATRATACEADADVAGGDDSDGDRPGAAEACAEEACTAELGTEKAEADEAEADEVEADAAEAAGAAMAVAEAAAAETIVDETSGVGPLVGTDPGPEHLGAEEVAAASDGGDASPDPAVRAGLEASLPDAAQASIELALLEGDVADVPSEEIPTLTESVELDFESGQYRLVADQGRDGSAAPRGAAPEDEDDALESMSAELAEAIFGSDEAPPAAQPAQASRGAADRTGPAGRTGAAGRAAEIVELSGRSGSGATPRQTSPSTLKPARRMP